ncbi:hypothetical protein [Candidatus Lariskella endosymbiont of Hedychridium roseum]|uniref:hypothetical protein n=1 Tax=Candidatus Lariskella endosymbiont of Hedychridium roseum TaxID=3077949 RepID=UPI0030D2D4AB
MMMAIVLLRLQKVLLLSEEGIRKHLKDYHVYNKLRPKNGGGASKLSAKQEHALIKHVYARDIGFYIEREYGISYTLSGTRAKSLRASMKWVPECQKAL